VIKIKFRKMKGTFKLGKVAGIDLFIHWTFSLLIVFIVYTIIGQGITLSFGQ
jgi:Zn-dependent protease